MNDSQVWNIIDTYFSDNPNALVKHHIESYNRFYKNDIFSIFKENNPIKIVSKEKSNGEIGSECNVYIGGKNGDKIYFGKPVIYDGKGKERYMLPNEARLRNMTYSMTIHYDIDVDVVNILDENEEPSLEGNEFTKGINDGLIDIVEDLEEDMNGGGPKKPAQPKARLNKAVINKLEEIRTTQSIAKRISEEVNNSINDINGVKSQISNFTIENIFLGRFPIMVQSEFCILNGMTKENRFSMGECKNDKGGYFIIDGKEKVVVSQEKFADNILYIRDYTISDDDEKDELSEEGGNDNDETDDKPSPEFVYSAQIVSVSENSSKFARTFSIKMVNSTKSSSNMNIVVNIPNVKKPVPLFIVFRALGIISDKDIIKTCLLDINKYESMIDVFLPSVLDGRGYNTQEECLNFIGLLTKGMSISHAHEILTEYLLPHIGKHNYLNKAFYIGFMVFKILCVKVGISNPTDRDNFKHKRIELVGPLLYNLFNEYYKIQIKSVHLGFEQILYYNKGQYESNLSGLIRSNYSEIFKKNKDLEVGVNKAFKGNWGAHSHTKRLGVVQGLDRLSFNSMMSHLRKFVLPLDPQLKVVEPRKLHSTHWGFIDPIDTPDGANIGFHKNLALSTQVTRGYPSIVILKWLHENINIHILDDCEPITLSKMSKVFVNGSWIGGIDSPIECVEKIIFYRRNGLIPIYTSATFSISENIVYIYTDGGRLCRPIFYVKDNELFGKDSIKLLESLNETVTWNQMITGFNKKSLLSFDPNDCKVYELKELYDGLDSNNPKMYEKFSKKKAIIDFIDCSETENSLIAVNSLILKSDKKKNKYTHCEIHESLIFGMMGNQITFPETNPMARNLFSCGQSKQACSLYHTNYQMRMDKSSMVLNYGQIPLLKSRYSKYINNDENSYGENAIVAIMCYTGYNVEDAILINEGALNRGLFRTSYFTTYETREENTLSSSNVWVDKKIGNVDGLKVVQGKKVGYVYEKLDSTGMIREGEVVDDRTVLIGFTSNSVLDTDKRVDQSIVPKKGQLGFVDKSYLTEGEHGERIGKVRIVDQRIPTLGDKFASRVGQKGTIGMVIREVDMPFTNSGIRPDIIINPHAIPSRMTIGQLVESITGKACALNGAFGDCTAFNQKGTKVEEYGEMLLKSGFHSQGNEIMYDGMTGQQIESNIFIGPTYYMRLKHMVKDKINFRGKGPNEQLTRQSVGGRANDGGLRIGEMEKDSIVSYGATNFLAESMMERGDKFHFAVCNKSGVTAIYNPEKNLFFSPIIDGPVKFSGLTTSENIKIENISQHGRDFSVISVPYTLKLLIQELGCMNIQLRIITEDNIEQLNSLASSSDIININSELKRIIIKEKIPEELLDDNEFFVDEHNLTNNVDNSEVKPNVVPIIGEIIYDWKLVLSDKYKKLYWFNVRTNKSSWTDPPEIVRRNEILNMPNDNNIYKTGDSVYYLDSNTNPNTIWKIDNISIERKILTLIEVDNIINKVIFPQFNIELLRHIFTPLESINLLTTQGGISEGIIEETKEGTKEGINEEMNKDTSRKIAGGTDFLVNEIVFLVNDIKFEREWHILAIDNEKIVIETDDIDDLNQTETVKTVVSNDIYRPQLIIPTNNNVQTPMNGGIVFAPIIKVYNGGESPFNNDDHYKSNNDQNVLIKEPIQITNIEPTQTTTGSSSIDSIIDFTKNLIVKKLN